MKINLFVNTNSIRHPLTGIGYYTLNIIKELLNSDINLKGIKNGTLLNHQDLKYLVVEFEKPHSIPKKTKSIKLFIVAFLRKFPGIYNLKKILVDLKAKRQLSILSKNNYVYFEPSFIPMHYDGHIITTIHDLSFITYPEFHPKRRVDFLKYAIHKSVEKSSHIIVDSDFIRHQLNSYFPKSFSKSSTVYLGVSSDFRVRDFCEKRDLLKTLNLNDKSFILSVATIEPRKNLKRLVEAYSKLSTSLRMNTPLVLAGNFGWKNDDLFSESKFLVEQNQIIFTGYLSDEDLKCLYASAQIFVYPSLYEGFGLPIIEAMSSGIPVITSNIGATAEIAGDSAVLIDPYSVDDISVNLEKLLRDPKLRNRFSAKGLEQVKKYKWKYTTDNILKIAASISNIK